MVIVKETTLSQALHRSRRKRATAHPAVALDTIPYLHCRHAQAVPTLEQSKSGTGARRDLQASHSRWSLLDTTDLRALKNSLLPVSCSLNAKI